MCATRYCSCPHDSFWEIGSRRRPRPRGCARRGSRLRSACGMTLSDSARARRSVPRAGWMGREQPCPAAAAVDLHRGKGLMLRFHLVVRSETTERADHSLAARQRRPAMICAELAIAREPVHDQRAKDAEARAAARSRSGSSCRCCCCESPDRVRRTRSRARRTSRRRSSRPAAASSSPYRRWRCARPREPGRLRSRSAHRSQQAGRDCDKTSALARTGREGIHLRRVDPDFRHWRLACRVSRATVSYNQSTCCCHCGRRPVARRSRVSQSIATSGAR